MRYPIEQSDIDKAIEKIAKRKLLKQETGTAPKIQQPPKRKVKKLSPKEQRRLDREWIASRHTPLTLDEAAARLNDDKVWAKTSKGISAKDD